jgi:hypothetical protein
LKEIVGQLWDYFGREPYIVLITTSGSLRKNGKAVCGRGCAAEARIKINGFEKLVGAHIQNFGNVIMLTDRGYGVFPVKHEWWQEADPKLIAQSANQLVKIIKHEDFTGKTFLLPRPGCGAGGLQWPHVRPILEAAGLPDSIWVISHAVA